MSLLRNTKSIALLVLTLVLTLSLAGCQQLQKSTFDAAGYIQAMLDSSYKSENQSYIGFTGVTAQEAAANHTTTAGNAAARFFEKHGLNPSEAQNTALSALFGEGYKQCSYTVKEQVDAPGGFTVDVVYTPLTSLEAISDQVDKVKERQGDKAYDLGAAYIDDIIEQCRSTLASPAYGSNVTETFDIRLSDNGELSLNKNLFAKIDKEIFPV